MILNMEYGRIPAGMQQNNTGDRLVFTNGCFDLLHAGHVDYLQRARSFGDRLIVGMNSDESVRAIKGDLRPLVPEQQRLETLAALDCVDDVVMFHDTTPGLLVHKIRPSVYVKGADYLNKPLPERDIVEAYGGEVKLVHFRHDISTTQLIGRILERYGGNRNVRE